MSNGNWYCKTCGYLPSTRVTFAETCDSCHVPVEWHDADPETALEKDKRIEVLLWIIKSAVERLEDGAASKNTDNKNMMLLVAKHLKVALNGE